MTKQASSASLIYGSHLHHLDHIGPLASLLEIPLFVTEEELKTFANHYYPSLLTINVVPSKLAEKITSSYEIVFSSLPKDLFDQIFFLTNTLLNKKLLNVWVPHGNSDKGHHSYFMEGLKKETIALVYGKKMIDFFIEKKVYSQLDAAITVGNYRYDFYKQHKSFYDTVATKEIFSLFPKGNKTVLYAPTWQDAENSSSLNLAWPLLLKTLPDNWNLLLKLHPNEKHHPHKIQKFFEEAEKRDNVHVIENFPPIYPLLSQVDCYLGDMSSIGYDFLTFKKPMFFLNQNRRELKKDPSLFLFRCGRAVEPEEYETVFSLIQKEENPFSQIQEDVYRYVFGPSFQKEDLKKIYQLV
jgi:CDP-glycerol glycerophosphotransferase (TagB/SpsB family)